MKFSFGKWLLLFMIVPFVELYLLLKLASLTSPLSTFVIIIATGVLGAYFARQQGRLVFRSINLDLQQGHMPADSLTNGLCVLIGGILLLTPGILTDALGFALVLPMTRRPFVNLIKRQFSNFVKQSTVHIYSNISQSYRDNDGFCSFKNRPIAGDEQEYEIVEDIEDSEEKE